MADTGPPLFWQRFRRRVLHLSKETLIGIAILVVIFGAARALLPDFLRHEINRKLNSMSDYSGHVDSVSVQVWHGGYTMQNLVVMKRNGKVRTPFLFARRLSFSIAYRMLVKGEIVSDIDVDGGRINFVKGPTAETTTGVNKGQGWQEVAKSLFPIDITHLGIRHTDIHYIDTSKKPRVDVPLDDITLEADGLSNRPSPTAGTYPAHLHLAARSIGNGVLVIQLDARPLAKEPTFNLTVSLKGVSLLALNDFVKAYLNLTFGGGSFDMYAEVRGADGAFRGYLKPFFKDVKYANVAEDEKATLWQRVWKGIVSTATAVVKNKSHNDIATVVPFSGKFSQAANIRVWSMVGHLLHNGFIQALKERFGGPEAPKLPPVPAPTQKTG